MAKPSKVLKKDQVETFKFLITLPTALVAEIDMLYPKPRYPSRSKVIELILQKHMDALVTDVPDGALEEAEILDE